MSSQTQTNSEIATGGMLPKIVEPGAAARDKR